MEADVNEGEEKQDTLGWTVSDLERESSLHGQRLLLLETQGLRAVRASCGKAVCE